MCLGPWLFFVALYINIYTPLKQVNTIQIISSTGFKLKTESMISWWWYDDIISCGSIRNRTSLPAVPLYPLEANFIFILHCEFTYLRKSYKEKFTFELYLVQW
jgi:hypothetical protein